MNKKKKQVLDESQHLEEGTIKGCVFRGSKTFHLRVACRCDHRGQIKLRQDLRAEPKTFKMHVKEGEHDRKKRRS